MARDAELILARIYERRDRHRARALPIRSIVVAVGALLAVPGVVLTVVFPEAGIPLLVVGLRLLALEYDWAARALGWVILRWERVRGWFKRQSRGAHVAMTTIAIAIGAAITIVIV